MNLKSLKIVGIFMVVTIVSIVGGLSIYFLIEKNKTFYIYDVRIVEPMENSRYFVYTDNEPEEEYLSMKNKTVYMKNTEVNKFEIAVYAYTSINTTSVDITSSNTNVATISYSQGHCYVEYHCAGQAEITAEVSGVKDTIVLDVYDNVAESFKVYDDAYYGDYNSSFSNEIVSYADDTSYYYRYETSSFNDGSKSGEVNDELLRVDESKVDKDIFSVARIDPITKSLNIRCNAFDKDGNKISKTVDTSLVIQSYYFTNDGDIKVENNYIVTVRVVADTPEYLQILLATTPDFEDGSVYVYTKNINAEEIDVTDKDLVDEVLSNQKEKNYLYESNEFETYKSFFTDKVSKIYIRLRKVYTNGSIVYLNPLTLEANPFEELVGKMVEVEDDGETVTKFETVESNSTYFRVAANQNYYVLTLDEEYFETNDNFAIKLTLTDYAIDSKEFVFEYRSLTQENISDFYTYDEETGTYTYSYWDPRTHFDGEVYNSDGNIIDFVFEEA